MISSTMMKGATICLASRARTVAETTTIAVSQAQVGILAGALPKLDLGQAAGDLPRLGRLRRDTDVRSGLAHVAQNRVVGRTPSCRGLERRHVELGDALHVVLAPCEVGRALAHGGADVGPCCEKLQRRSQSRHLVCVGRNLER